MSIVAVQCKGSGVQIQAGFAKRGTCPVCHNQQDLTSNGKLRKHKRLLRSKQLRKMR